MCFGTSYTYVKVSFANTERDLGGATTPAPKLDLERVALLLCTRFVHQNRDRIPVQMNTHIRSCVYLFLKQIYSWMHSREYDRLQNNVFKHF